jgi:hypothetical protein
MEFKAFYRFPISHVAAGLLLLDKAASAVAAANNFFPP